MRKWSVGSPCTVTSLQAARLGVKHTQNTRYVQVCNQRPAQSSYTATQEWKSANPGFDEIELDEEYYRSLGISEEELADQLAFLANDADPMGEDLGPEGLDKQQLGASSYLMDEDMNEATWGPQAIMLAGFKAEECAIIRCILDSAGSALVKVIPCTSDMLYLSVETGMNEPEVDWSQPRPEKWGRGREWGSQRVILFSGVSGGTVLTIVELLEEAGLPPLCIAMAEEEDAHRVVGEVLAEAVKAQRGRKTPQKHVWEVPGHAGRLPDLEELIGSQARARVAPQEGHSRENTQVVQDEQQQFTEDPLSSSTIFPPAGADPLHADDADTGSNSHTLEVLSSTPGEAATRVQHQHSPTAAHSSAEHKLTEAAQEANVAESGAMSAEDAIASKHTAAMAPGIDALRKRKAAAQEQPSADGAESPTQLDELQAGQEQESAAAAAASGLPNNQIQTATQAGIPLADAGSIPTALQQEHQAEPSQHQALNLGQQSTQPLSTNRSGTPHTGTDSGHHADGISDESGSVQEERQSSRAETRGVQSDYDSLLDAIAAGEFDWEAPAAEDIPSSQASKQQPSSSQPAHTALEESPSSDPTSSKQHVKQEQVGATPTNSADHSLEHATAAAATDTNDRHQSPATTSYPTDKPGSAHLELSPGSSQQSAEAKPSQDTFSTQQDQEAAEAAKQAWPWDARRAAAGTPSLSSDVVARSSSRLRLRRASSSLQPPKRPGRTKKAAGKAKTLSDLLRSKSSRPSSQGSMQETKWRVTNSQQMTAEEFAKPPPDIDSHRPVWAAAQAAPAAQDGSGIDEEAAQDESKPGLGASPSESRPLTKQELRDLAARRGLDYQRLLADAVSRGIPVSE